MRRDAKEVRLDVDVLRVERRADGVAQHEDELVRVRVWVWVRVRVRVRVRDRVTQP